MRYYGFHAGTNDGTRHAPERVAVVLHYCAPQHVLFFLAESGKSFQAVVAVTRHDCLF